MTRPVLPEFLRARGALALTALALLVAADGAPLAGCASSPDAGRTRVARVRLVERTGVGDYDTFFGVVYQVQVALNEFERVRITALADLADALRLAPDADLEAVGAALHDRALDLAEHGVRLTVERPDAEQAAAGGDSTEPTPATPTPRATAPAMVNGRPGGAQVFPEPQSDAAAHAGIEVGTEGEGPVTADTARLVAALRTTIRNAIGLRRRMEEIELYAPQILAAGRSLARTVDQRAPAANRAELRREFADALSFLEGAAARARAQGQVSQRVAVRLRASARSAAANDQ